MLLLFARRRCAALRCVLVGAFALVLGSGSASAVGFDLDVEFDSGQIGSFAHVTIEENASDLDFRIELNDSLGEDADLHELYFNLLGSFTGLAISTSDPVSTPYALSPNPAVLGGAGSSFDFAVNFGNGAGGSGNGLLAVATFTLTADQPLSIASLLESSFASGGTIESQLAAHVQGTALFVSADSETVGGVVPEPATASLLGLGIAALGAARRSAARRRPNPPAARSA